MNAYKRRFGGLKGQVQIADDFDAPLDGQSLFDGVDALDSPDQVVPPLDAPEVQEKLRQAREKCPWLGNPDSKD
jgi:hypothetical protein